MMRHYHTKPELKEFKKYSKTKSYTRIVYDSMGTTYSKITKKNTNPHIFHDLPNDIVQHILSYSDQIIYRNGVYMNRIPRTDFRYNILANIVRPPTRSNDYNFLNAVYLSCPKQSVLYTYYYRLYWYYMTNEPGSPVMYMIFKLKSNNLSGTPTYEPQSWQWIRY